jgi:hypothetical protein
VKYFTISEPNGKEHGPVSSKRSVVAVLDSLPSLDGVEIVRWWWVRDELVDTDVYEPRKFLATRAHELQRGATAQWAAARGRL